MITAKLEPLPEAQEIELRRWLGKGEINTLIRVIEAKMKANGCKALDDAKKASDHEAKLVTANEHLRQAQRYATFLTILKEITEQTEKFTTIKLS